MTMQDQSTFEDTYEDDELSHDASTMRKGDEDDSSQDGNALKLLMCQNLNVVNDDNPLIVPTKDRSLMEKEGLQASFASCSDEDSSELASMEEEEKHPVKQVRYPEQSPTRRIATKFPSEQEIAREVKGQANGGQTPFPCHEEPKFNTFEIELKKPNCESSASECLPSSRLSFERKKSTFEPIMDSSSASKDSE